MRKVGVAPVAAGRSCFGGGAGPTNVRTRRRRRDPYAAPLAGRSPAP